MVFVGAVVRVRVTAAVGGFVLVGTRVGVLLGRISKVGVDVNVREG